MLSELDEVDWSAPTHAYGSAEDTPELLRLIASPDARDAISELYGSIFHQGTVYPATVAAIPFLAELAAHAPRRRDELVWMLGMLADPRHAYGAAFPAVRAAVAAQLPVLVTLLADDDASVRDAAVKAGTDVAPLVRRWEIETDPAVGASVALALGHVGAAASLSNSALHAEPVVRVAAAVAMLRADVTWLDGMIAALVDAMDAGVEITYCLAVAGDRSSELITAPDDTVALELLDALLAARTPQTRRAGIRAASQRCEERRSAPSLFLPPVVSIIDDPDEDVRREVFEALRRAGHAAGRYADLLAERASGYPRMAGSGGMIDDFAKEYLHNDLRGIREVMVWKLDNLSEYDIRRPLTFSGTNLLGLVKHLTMSEARYFGQIFGRPFPGLELRWDDDDMWAAEDETREEIVNRYRRACAHSDDTITALAIDAPGHVPWWPRPDVMLFNVMAHVLTETSRHAGHADILREQLDGATGAWPGRGGSAPDPAYREKIERAATAVRDRDLRPR